MNKHTKFILFFSAIVIAIVLVLLFRSTNINREKSNQILRISAQLTHIIQTNEQIKLHCEKITLLRQFALKEPEQVELKILHAQLRHQKYALDSIVNVTIENVPNLSAFRLYADTIARNINQSESPINIMVTLSPSDFNWKEKQKLSSAELKNVLPKISHYIHNFQAVLMTEGNDLERQKSVQQTSFVSILFLTIALLAIFVIRPLLNHSKKLEDSNNSLNINTKAMNRKVTELNSTVMNLEEKIIEEKNQNIIINKSLEEKNKEIKKFKEDSEYFTYIISHDLKAPLRAISSLSSWIQEDINDSLEEEQKKYLDILRSRVQRMDDLINGILNFAMAGKKNNKSEKIYLNQLVSEIILSLEGSDNAKFDIQSDLPLMITDKTALQIVLKHLFSNALKFNTANIPKITMTCIQKVDFYEIEISDNGIGIEQAYHEQVFEIFRTLENGTEKGTGVGLSISKKIVQDKGGKIWVESTPGKGSSFFFTWPA